MAVKTLILGNSGTGKSASLRNFDADDICVINCAGKPLPFQNDFEQHTPSYENMTSDITKILDQTDKKIIIVDDAQYIMSFQYMRRIHENGWEKWNDIQSDFFKIIQICNYLPADVTVYFLSHITKDDDGNEKIKTMGKMLDEKITVEGLFTTVLKTSVQDGQYYFITQNSGRDTVKSPMGMFDTYAIDNDLAYVDARIRNYYKIGDFKTDDEVAEMGESAAAPEVEKPDKKGRTRTRKTKNDEVKEEEKQEPAQEEAPEEKPAEKPKRGRRKKTVEPEAEAEPEAEEEKPKKRTRKRREPKEDEGEAQ